MFDAHRRTVSQMAWMLYTPDEIVIQALHQAAPDDRPRVIDDVDGDIRYDTMDFVDWWYHRPGLGRPATTNETRPLLNDQDEIITELLAAWITATRKNPGPTLEPGLHSARRFAYLIEFAVKQQRHWTDSRVLCALILCDQMTDHDTQQMRARIVKRVNQLCVSPGHHKHHENHKTSPSHEGTSSFCGFQAISSGLPNTSENLAVCI